MSKIIFTEIGTKPPAPSVGQVSMYVKTDEIVYIQDSAGTEIPLGSSASITALTGDVSATGPGSAVATVNSVGGSSAANIHSAELAANAATATNTPSTIVERDASGNFSANIITANLTGTATNATTAVNFTGSLSGDVTGTQSATVVSLVGGKSASDVASATATVDAATSANTASTLIERDASGNFSANIITANLTGTATNATTAVNFTGSLSGDVTGTQSATVVSLVGGKSASDVASATATVDAATSANTASTLIERDASGNFSANIITANLSGNATTATNATTAVNFTGSLSGDVTGTQSATSIASTVVTGKLLTGYVVGADTAISATDSILSAFEKVQGQLNTISTSAITALTGDVSATGPGSVPATLAIVNSNVGSFGSSTAIPTFTVNAKGLITAVSSNAVVAPAGTLTGTTLASNVVSSSLTSVGTITSGVWNGTPLTAPYMLALATNDIYVGNGSNQPAAVAMSGDLNIVSSGTTTIQPNVISNSKLAQMPADTLKGNNTGSLANAADLTVSQVNAMLGTVTTIGTFDSQTAQANGLDIVGNTLYAQSASTSNPGMVNITTQSFAGNKTFTGTVAITPSSTIALTINSTAFVVDSTNNVLGIGIQPSTAVMIDGVNITGASKLVQMTGYGVGSTTGYRGRFARGSLVTPSAVQSGDVLSAISGRGYGASQFAAASTGVVNIVAGETFTNTSNLTYLQFSTTPTGSVTSAEAMRVATTGVTLGPQSASTAIHQINGGLNVTTKTITASTYTVDTTTTDNIIYTDSTSNAITVTLPTATNGRIVIIQDKTGQASTNHITIAPPGAVTINGVNASVLLGVNYGGWVFTSDGTNWVAYRLAQLPSVQTISGTVIDWSTVGIAGGLLTKTLSADTTFTFSNAIAGQTIVIRLTNTASNYTVTWPTMKWPVQTSPVMTTGAFSDVYTIVYDGTNYYGSYVQNF